MKDGAESTSDVRSPVHEDHDYDCCRGSKVITISNSQHRPTGVQSGAGGETFWKVGHDSRRKLCIVGFNWNSSALRLSKLQDAAAKTDGGGGTSAAAAVDAGRTRPKERSVKSKLVLAGCGGEAAATRVSCDGAEEATNRVTNGQTDRWTDGRSRPAKNAIGVREAA